MTSDQAIIRNDLVAALSSALITPHASGQGRTLTTVHRALGFGCPVFTFTDEANADLIAAGAGGASKCANDRLDKFPFRRQ